MIVPELKKFENLSVEAEELRTKEKIMAKTVMAAIFKGKKKSSVNSWTGDGNGPQWSTAARTTSEVKYTFECTQSDCGKESVITASNVYMIAGDGLGYLYCDCLACGGRLSIHGDPGSALRSERGWS